MRHQKSQTNRMKTLLQFHKRTLQVFPQQITANLLAPKFSAASQHAQAKKDMQQLSCKLHTCKKQISSGRIIQQQKRKTLEYFNILACSMK